MPDLTLVASIIEKGGVIGVLIIALAVLVWELRRLRRELARVYVQRDFCRQVRARYKDRLERLGEKVDISDIEAEMKQDMGADE